MNTTIKPPQEEKITELYSGTLLIFGIAMAALGVVAILASALATIGAVLVLGGVLLAAGILECIQAFRMARKHKKHVLLNALSAIVYLCAGALLLFNPFAGALSLTLLIGAYLIVSGVINLFHGFRHRKEPNFGWFIFGGIVDLILGFIIVLGWPVTALWVIGLLIGIEMLTYGSAWIATSFAFKDIEKDLYRRTA